MSPPTGDLVQAEQLGALKAVATVVEEARCTHPPTPCVTPQSTVWSPGIIITQVLMSELFNLPKSMAVHFYNSINESILIFSITIAICHPSKTCAPPGPGGGHVIVSPPTLGTIFFF